MSPRQCQKVLTLLDGEALSLERARAPRGASEGRWPGAGGAHLTTRGLSLKLPCTRLGQPRGWGSKHGTLRRRAPRERLSPRARARREPVGTQAS